MYGELALILARTLPLACELVHPVQSSTTVAMSSVVFSTRLSSPFCLDSVSTPSRCLDYLARLSTTLRSPRVTLYIGCCVPYPALVSTGVLLLPQSGVTMPIALAPLHLKFVSPFAPPSHRSLWRIRDHQKM